MVTIAVMMGRTHFSLRVQILRSGRSSMIKGPKKDYTMESWYARI